MRVQWSFHFLTFVVFAFFCVMANAATKTSIPPNQYAPKEKSKTSSEKERLEIDSVQVTPILGEIPREELFSIKPTRFVRDLTWNAALGLWSGPLEEKDETISTQFLSLTQTRMNQDESAWEYGVDLTVRGNFGLHGEYKRYCCLGAWNEPYWTVGVGSLYKPSELLAGFVKMDSYQIQAGGGFEDLMRAERRVRIEGLVAQSNLGTSFLIRLGYAFDETALWTPF